MRKKLFLLTLFIAIILASCTKNYDPGSVHKLKESFLHPPDSARPGVYWYFMDGNMTREGMTKDLESMKDKGIGQVVFLEVNVGVPRGKVDFLSEEWLDNFSHMVREAERLGITITLGVGPGWTGSGGPWVKGSESMKHLVASKTEVIGGGKKTLKLAVPKAKDPYFGIHQFPQDLKERWENYYEDVAVLAFPAPKEEFLIDDILEKALYFREPYTSKPGVRPYLPTTSEYEELPESSLIQKEKITDLTEFLNEDGSLSWNFPEGKWIVMRLGSRNNGAITRPAPKPGVGFEADKFDTTAINAHLKSFTERLFARTGVPDPNKSGGLKMLHMDSWEMGAQNWTERFREEFEKRRGYDPLPYYPVYTGLVVGSLEESERFLWDLRLTSTELIVEYHAGHLKNYGKKYNMGFSIEPYDMNPTADMELGSVADVPMCEFWSKDYGFISAWSCIQAASIAHINSNPVVAAEAFTAHLDEWRLYPGAMKNQGDWAFAAGVNRLVYHTWQHQSLEDGIKPGMTMGPYGVHHHRNQTWWPMADGYHDYVSRCQFMLQQGKAVADILYLTPEGAPQVFRAPVSALTADNVGQKVMELGKHDSFGLGEATDEIMPDRKGYNFSGCAPSHLKTARVEDNKIVFPGGAEFKLLVLPNSKTMTPELLAKIEELILDGARVVGNPPEKSPALENYPECDKIVTEKAKSIWGTFDIPEKLSAVEVGEGIIYWGGDLYRTNPDELHPEYHLTADILKESGLTEDFVSSPKLRYIHKILGKDHIYFVSNKTKEKVNSDATFRVSGLKPELWNPVTGETRILPIYESGNATTTINLTFEPYQSYFIVFTENTTSGGTIEKNFPESALIKEITGPWEVFFDPQWGGPGEISFDKLTDWTLHEVGGIKYYSGIAVYKNTVELTVEEIQSAKDKLFIHTGEIYNMARVIVNGKDMGVIWTAPWEMNISEALEVGENTIEIHVANLWPNRLIGDEKLPDDGIKNGEWPEWLLEGKERSSGRYTFATYKHFEGDEELLTSGLLGPVKLISKNN